MENVRLAARVTAHAIRITQLEDELAAERARTDQLQATVLDLRLYALAQGRQIRRLERTHRARHLLIQRLRSRVQDARRSRDLWKHRALRGDA